MVWTIPSYVIKVKRMIDIPKQIERWRLGAIDDLDAARVLMAKGKLRHSLFFAHLALEKVLKGLVCKATGDIAPPIHNLSRLCAMAEAKVSSEQAELLSEVNEFNIEGRYPELSLPPPDVDEAGKYLREIEALFQWLNSQL